MGYRTIFVAYNGTSEERRNAYIDNINKAIKQENWRDCIQSCIDLIELDQHLKDTDKSKS